ncbi:fungal tRNA ligase adenylyltransferase [Sclerotinia borealis F-4128]|uniref:tRNA ligase n=1 Tax=Sclerotinia borealis (strain F-4128) TaxID=1432307 RepID=W9CJQ2_SCLBF|nr:fungal tRNA ligase adenylyltransferase [Sclerotinia borealis F-4128]
MARHGDVPFASQDVQEVQKLIRNLHDSKDKKKGFSCKETSFEVDGSPANLVVKSWRFQDWDYKRHDLPTYARGLFTSKNEKDQEEIATRGYDKFFNTGEVEATKWTNIENNTKGPYELSLKENGCIVFISGLHDGTLLVCSKHSTGQGNKPEMSHAKAGDRWVDKQLQAIGRTREELSRELRKRNATAVAELCDDDFEEHILAYGKEDAGLYLHGININLPEFMTYPGDQVQAFAAEWGFKKTDFLVMDDIEVAKSFLDQVAESGSYQGRDIEGFVIRCKARPNSTGTYSDWFFKYKFEEPYLMYRQWRECTKTLISGKAPRFKKHIKITEEYLLFARKCLAENSNLGKEYAQNHGIIKLRNDFLKEINLKGSDIIRLEYSQLGGPQEEVSNNIILVPVATIGCGKTTLALALGHLFGWGHVQNDNITGKARPPRFTKEVLTQLEEKSVVVADRNNASRHERKQLIEDVHLTHPHVRLIALNFVHDRANADKVRQVTQDRVLARGDNHQTLQAATDTKKVVGIMEGFVHRFEPLNINAAPDDGFECSIDLDPTKDSRENLETVVGQLSAQFPKLFTDLPTSKDLDEAIQVALSDYKPDLRHDVGRGPPKNNNRNQQKEKKPVRDDEEHDDQIPKNQPQITQKKKPLEYVSISLPRNNIKQTLDDAFGRVSSSKAMFYKALGQSQRVQPEFHVTLIHRANSKQYPELWQRYSDMHAEAGGNNGWSAGTEFGECQVMLERIVWDDRIMAIVARIVDNGWECTNEIAHITIGTRGDDVKPKESNDLLKRWLVEGSGDESRIGEIAIEGRKIVHGAVKGVLSK